MKRRVRKVLIYGAPQEQWCVILRGIAIPFGCWETAYSAGFVLSDAELYNCYSSPNWVSAPDLFAGVTA